MRLPLITVSWFLAGEAFSLKFRDAVTAARFAASLESVFIPYRVEHI